MKVNTVEPIECSWHDEHGVEFINTLTLLELFVEYLGLPDPQWPSSRHFPQFVEFIRTQFPRWIGLEFFLWSDM